MATLVMTAATSTPMMEVPEIEDKNHPKGGAASGIRRLRTKLVGTEPTFSKRRGPRMALKVARLLVAKRKLAAIIRHETPASNAYHPLRNDLEANPPRYLHLLRLHPSLAKDRFRRTVGLWGDEFSIYPLVFCIEIGAPLAIIREVFDMCPEALSQPVSPLEGDYPLHLACSQLHKNPVSVILFLAQAYADAVKMEDLDGFLPIHRLLYKPQRAATLHEVHSLLEIYPQSQAATCVFGSPLLLAMDNEMVSKRDVLSCLIARFPPDITDLQLGERVLHENRMPTPGSRKNYGAMTLDHARLIGRLLAQIQTLTLTPQQWSTRAFTHLMVELYRQPQLIELDLHLPPNLLQRDDNACATLQQLLQQNRGLLHLAIDFGSGAGDASSYTPNPDLSGTETCLHYLGAGLCQNSTLKTCHVSKNNITQLQPNFFRRAIWKPLAKVLQASNSMLEVVSIPHVEHEENMPKDGKTAYYYARLNKFGRSKAQDPRIALDEFVDLLVIANAYPGFKVKEGQARTQAEDGAWKDHPRVLGLQNVLFGLLQECPSRWAVA